MNGQTRGKYLPVGSVVLLQNGTKRVMINGFCTMDASKPDKIYDYSGVLFPEGSLSSDQTLLFDHEQIVRIDHIGLEDQEEKEFKVKLATIIASTNQGGAPVEPQVQPVQPTPQVQPVQPTPQAQPMAQMQPTQVAQPTSQPTPQIQPINPVQPMGQPQDPTDFQ